MGKKKESGSPLKSPAVFQHILHTKFSKMHRIKELTV